MFRALLDSGATKNFVRADLMPFHDVQPDPCIYTLACGEDAVRSKGIVRPLYTPEIAIITAGRGANGLPTALYVRGERRPKYHILDTTYQVRYGDNAEPRTNSSSTRCSSVASSFFMPILAEFLDIFAPPSVNDITKHSIEVTDNRPINQRPYPLSPTKTKILYEQLDEMLANGIIEPSTSQYSSPPVLVERAGKAPRFCID
ncbi:uncharacterized protein LOC108916558 [Anoplophora glabripennis]|uniref:uncharacterized protein LOC108916558 n=1 Tax=Anoplophora glabripennis TaxID=217634 RepID=UPI00087441CD|nr:uncharacterized protein LOC108916558 [Anoplophora glabripennis]